MSKKRKAKRKSDKHERLETIVLVTAIVNLLAGILELIQKLLE